MATVAEELRDYGAYWAAWVYQGPCFPDAGADLRAREASAVVAGLDVDLMTLGLELTAKLCRWCAEERARAFLSLRKRVFVGLLASFQAVAA